MPQDDPMARGSAVAEEALLGMRDRRAAHPRASRTEIEAERDARLARRRGQMLRDAAQAGPLADCRDAAARRRPAAAPGHRP